MSGTLTLGVVGHVDHGKTALVRALTGIETDRLREERERGLSIVLGFSYLETPHGVVDLIDVPGHEDFIRAMISGATGVDGVVLCVAANEGIKPQTVEHLNIAALLGIETGFVVLTKVDLMEPAELAAVQGSIESFLADTFLAGARVVRTSSVTGEGIDAVRDALAVLAARPPARDAHERFFMPLDRVFTMKGFGVVVTGTLRHGPVGVNDRIEVLPGRREASIRALQNHNRPVERIEPGQRAAVNLRNIGREQLRRGDVIATPGFLKPTRRIDAEVTLLATAPEPLRNGTAVRLLTGTIEAIARLRLLDARELEPGGSCLAQLRLDREIATHASERCLLRSYSPMHTIGGGRFIDVNAQRHRRFDAKVSERLESAASGDAGRIARQRLVESDREGIDISSLAEETDIDDVALRAAVVEAGAVAVGQHRFVGAHAHAAVCADVQAALERFHEAQPLKNGLDIGSLAGMLEPQPPADVLLSAVTALVDQRKIAKAQELLCLAGFDPFASLGQRERQMLGEIEAAYRKAGLEAPPQQEIVGADRSRLALHKLLLDSGRLVRLRTYDRKAGPVLHAATLADVTAALERAFPHPAAFAVKDVRDLLGSTRKHVVPLLEHLDATGFTTRHGDQRRLRQGNDSGGQGNNGR